MRCARRRIRGPMRGSNISRAGEARRSVALPPRHSFSGARYDGSSPQMHLNLLRSDLPPARVHERQSEAQTSAASKKPIPPNPGGRPPVRIFTACHGTQLLVIQHLRRHLQLPPAEEFLLWYPMENIPFIDSFMQEVIS